MTFQEQLITLRKQQGLSQEQLGAKLGVTRQTVSKWELGITTPEMDKLMLLADLFHISIDELVGRKRKNGESETEHGHTAEAVPPVKEIHYIPYPWHYEYKSRRTLFGLPLVHINIGRWIPGQKHCRAKGVIAIGNFASGFLALGGIASGIFSVGGIGMLEAHQAAWDMGDRKTRGFDEIAVLCRTHHQAELVERCLKQESIPYIVAGREDFLTDSAVQDSLCFFRYLEDSGDLPSVRLCAERLWNLEWNDMTAEAVRTAGEKFRPLYRKKKPQKFMEQWMDEMGLSDSPAMQKLLQMTVFYKTMPEFMTALDLGVESDLKRCGTKKYTSGAVTIMTLHGSKGLEFPVVFIYGADQGSIPLENEKHPSDPEEERRLFYVGITRAKEELLLTTSGEISEFLVRLPDGLVQEENAVKKRKEENWHQMSLFEM